MISIPGVAPPYFLSAGCWWFADAEGTIYHEERERERGDLDIGVTALRAVTITDRTSVINHRTAPTSR